MKRFLLIIPIVLLMLFACEKEKNVTYKVINPMGDVYLQNEEESLFVCNAEVFKEEDYGTYVKVSFKRLNACKNYDNWCGTGRFETGYVKVLKVKQ